MSKSHDSGTTFQQAFGSYRSGPVEIREFKEARDRVSDPEHQVGRLPDSRGGRYYESG